MITGFGVAVPLDKEMTEDILEQPSKSDRLLFVSNRFFPMAQRIFERVDRLERLIASIRSMRSITGSTGYCFSDRVWASLRFFGDVLYGTADDHNAL